MFKAISKILKDYIFKLISIKLFGTIVGGVYGFLLDKVISKAIIPIVNSLLLEGKLEIDKVLGKIKAKKLQKAQDENNQNNYDDATDNIFK